MRKEAREFTGQNINCFNMAFVCISSFVFCERADSRKKDNEVILGYDLDD